MKVLLVYPPFCTPACPPFSLTNIYSFLKTNSEHEIKVLDLNLEFHKLKFPEYQQYYQNKNWENYDEITSKFRKESAQTYSNNNKVIINKELPEFFEQLKQKIEEEQPDIVAFSIVYSSQVFYTYALIKELKAECVIGGPSVSDKLRSIATELKNELELLEHLNEKPVDFNIIPDFSIYNLNDYFIPEPVIPLKTCSTCFYRGCTFCTHFQKTNYYELDLNNIKQAIIKSKQKHFFLIDDMISTERLIQFANLVKPLNIKWCCQLRPTKDLTPEILTQLYESGLTMAMWGIESGSQRILDLINKNTNLEDIKQALANSHKAGIKNITYIIFGFPSETKEEFLQTINFLKTNEQNIDLISGSIFGLHKDTPIYKQPKKFGITQITEEPRTLLEPKITFEGEGLSTKEATKLRDNYSKTIENINKFPKEMNFFREHMLLTTQ